MDGGSAFCCIRNCRLWTTNNFSTGGDLSDVTYSDATPALSFTFDRSGRPLTATSGTNTTTFLYNNADLLISESFTAGFLNTYAVSNSYDALFRRSKNYLVAAGSVISSSTNSYDAASRLATVTDGTIATAVYSYLANSPLISQIVLQKGSTPKLTNSYAYDLLNRITQVSAKPSSDSAMIFDYAYNLANQRTSVTNLDSSRWAYSYDALGQVRSGKRYWSDGTIVAGQQYEYGFDDIGNRTSAASGGDEWGANLRYQSYTVNNLNQYTQRTVPGSLDVIGTARTNSTVTVNSQPAYRKSDYFRTDYSINNATNAVWQGLTNVGVLNNGTNKDIITTNSGNAFVAMNPESFGYDADGNLTNDGRWVFTWDAENRLTRMEPAPGIPDGSKKKLLFGYDHLGRRIFKTVSNYNAGAWSFGYTRKFTYDGWNLTDELDGNNGLLRVYTWGLDLSGSAQGAGGVGGLLSVRWYPSPLIVPTNFYYCYDGNGNVTALVNNNDGTIAAQYEYGPFGEVLRADGYLGATNSMRFSTKYNDLESELVYFGFRYYNPLVGRWLNRDPIEEAAGSSLYALLSNDPCSQTDVLGLSLYAFDGTKNNKDKEEKAKNTNVAILWGIYQAHGIEGSFYKNGLGTGDGILNPLGTLNGFGFKKRVTDMFETFEKQYKKGDCAVDIVGFSRGAAEARDFANRIKDEHPQASIRWLGLFDTVESVGLPATDAAGYRMAIPDTVERAFQIVAGDEHRRFFPSTSILSASGKLDPRYQEITLPGAHSDIGGGYKERRGLANTALRVMWQDGINHKVPFGAIPVLYREYRKEAAHDSRLPYYDIPLDIVTGRWGWFRGSRPRTTISSE